MFNKLLLVFSFCAFILSKKAVIVDDAKDIPKHNPDLALIGRYERINDDDVLIYSDYCETEDDNDSRYSYFDLKSQQPAETLLAISEDELSKLKVEKERSQEELAESSKCFKVSQYWKYQALIAYAAYFINGSDILPSLTYLVSNGPKYDSYIGERNGITYSVKSEIDTTCEDYYYFWESVFHNGIVDQSCIPEDFTNIPGYNYEYWYGKPRPEGSPPRVEEECVDGGGAFNPQFKGYGRGSITGGNITTLKEAITKYGPVLITQVSYAIDDSTQPDGFILYNKHIPDQKL
ncbi:MAG: hypothetical protein EZS28_041556, partial [Streblomastix strix]